MKNRKILSLFLAILMILSLTACGSSKDSYDIDYGGTESKSSIAANGISKSDSISQNFYNVNDYNIPQEPTYENGEEFDNIETTNNYNERKIVYRASVDTETKDIEKAMNSIYELINQNNGYIDSETRNNWNSFEDVYTRRNINMTIKVPSENFQKFLDSISDDYIIITSMNRSSQDLSNSYYDKEMRIESLKIQETRLLELLKESTTVDIMLQIENSLTDVRYEIETLTKDLRLIDSDVEYSTITFYMYEVQRYGTPINQPQSFWEELWIRIQDSFENFVYVLRDILFVVVELVPFILLITVIAVIVIIIIKRKKKKKLNIQKTEDKK